MTPRERAVSRPEEPVGVQRYGLYARAWDRVIEAERAGFFLEAITLLDSLITDRMESRASYLTGMNFGFKNLGKLIEKFRANEKDDNFLAVIDRIDVWRESRNKVIHELVKFESGEKTSWTSKTRHLALISAEGKQLLRDFDELDKAERQRNNAKPAATQPFAFDQERRHALGIEPSAPA